MKPSENCKAIIRDSEGLRLAAYLCPAGIPSIGYGHTKGVRLGDVCTRAQAETWLDVDLVDATRAVAAAVTVPLMQGQFDAMVSIVYNTGPGAKGVKDGIITLKSGGPSTLLRKLNAGDYAGAAAQFDLWVNGGGMRLPGLVTRRARERALFEGKA